MMLIKTTTDPIPGNADTNPSTTVRSDGEIEITRSTRKILSARKTDSSPTLGKNAIPTITKSKRFQPFVKKR